MQVGISKIKYSKQMNLVIISKKDWMMKKPNWKRTAMKPKIKRTDLEI